MTLANKIIEHGPYDAAVHPRYGAQTYSHTGAELNELRDELIAARRVTTYEEWRVTGTDEYGGELAGVVFTPAEDGDAEAEARSFAHWGRARGWTDGPHLHKRTVTVTDWEAVE